jgi:hypothetical protein
MLFGWPAHILIRLVSFIAQTTYVAPQIISNTIVSQGGNTMHLIQQKLSQDQPTELYSMSQFT